MDARPVGQKKEKFMRMQVRPGLISLYLTISMFLGFYGSSSVLSQPPPSPPPQESTMYIKGFKAFVTLEGRPQYLLEADMAVLAEKENRVELENIHLIFYKEGSTEPSGTLTAKKGIYYYQYSPDQNRQNNDIDLTGDVLFHTTDGTLLKTPEVHYDAKKEKIFSKAGFEKRNETRDQTIVISGKSFVTDKNLEHWEDTGAKLSFESHPQPAPQEK